MLSLAWQEQSKGHLMAALPADRIPKAFGFHTHMRCSTARFWWLHSLFTIACTSLPTTESQSTAVFYRFKTLKKQCFNLFREACVLKQFAAISNKLAHYTTNCSNTGDRSIEWLFLSGPRSYNPVHILISCAYFQGINKTFIQASITRCPHSVKKHSPPNAPQWIAVPHYKQKQCCSLSSRRMWKTRQLTQ